MFGIRSAGRAVLAVVVICCSSIHAGVIRSDVPDSSYKTLGASPQYASAGKITFGNNTDWASGVLVSGEWMLTAAHVVRSNAINNTPGNVLFTVGGNSYSADQIVLNPGYVSATPENGNDIALVHLSSVVTNVTPVALYTGSSELGEIGTYVGFGRTGNGTTGLDGSYTSVLRGGTQAIDLTGNQVSSSWSSNLLVSDFDSPTNPGYSSWGSSTPTPLEYLPADKDSGSPLYIDDGGITYLAGIVSFALFNSDGIQFGYGDGVAATRISGQAAWIQSYGVPELSSGLMSVTGLMALVSGSAFIRRRKA